MPKTGPLTKDCAEFFAKLDPDGNPDFARRALWRQIEEYEKGNIVFRDPTTDNPVMGTILTNFRFTGQDAVVNNWTVMQFLNDGQPSRPGSADGWSPYGYNFIFLRPTAVNAENVAHELLHKIYGFNDETLLLFLLGTETNFRDTSQISSEFGKACL